MLEIRDESPPETSREDGAWHHVPQQHRRQRLLVRQQRAQRLGRHLGEGLVGGGEDGEGVGVLDGVQHPGLGEGLWLGLVAGG